MAASHSGAVDDIEEQASDASAATEVNTSSEAGNQGLGCMAKLTALACTILSALYRLLKRISYYIYQFTIHIAMVPLVVSSICITGDFTILDYPPPQMLFMAISSFLCMSGFLPWVLQLTSFVTGIRDYQRTSMSGHMIIVSAIRLGCLALFWLVVNLSTPSLKRVTLLWKWSLLAGVALLGYPILIIVTLMLEKFTTEINENFSGSNAEYCIKGLEASVALLLSFASFFLVWLFCIHDTSDGLNRYGMFTLVSLLVGALLSVLKSGFLLWWETTFIFNRYKGRILMAGFKLFYLYPLFVKWLPTIDALINRCPWDWADGALDDRCAMEKAKEIEGTQTMEAYMLLTSMRLQDINDAATCVKTLFLTDNAILKTVPKLRQDLQVNGKDPITDTILQQIEPVLSKQKAIGILFHRVRMEAYQAHVANQILTALRMDLSKETVTYDEFETWIVDALEDGFLMRLKLIGATERMKKLDKVLMGSIFALVILFWLFITGLATTKVVVALASIFLGLSFMFADAFKAFFLGLVFTFVMHPFDVGDRCIINDKELLVKEVNILTTIFEDGYNDFVIYPNSDLATKNITKHRSARKQKPDSKPAPEDLIELFLHSSTTSLQIRNLQQHMDKCLQDGIKCGRYSLPYNIMVEEINGDNIKMSIQFKHNLDDGDVSKKNKQRSELLLEIKQFLEESNTSANHGFRNSTAKRSNSL